jgi:hypothetical protein
VSKWTELYRTRREQGLCARCGEASPDSYRCEGCRGKDHRHKRVYRAANPDERRERHHRERDAYRRHLLGPRAHSALNAWMLLQRRFGSD